MMKNKPRQHRDLSIFKTFIDAEQKKTTPEDIQKLKQAFKKHGYDFLTKAAQNEETGAVKGSCDSNVCYAVVCVFSTSCSGSACVSNGCSALVDHCGFTSNSDPCDGGQKTCGSSACGTSVSQTPPECGSGICGSKAY